MCRQAGRRLHQTLPWRPHPPSGELPDQATQVAAGDAQGKGEAHAQMHPHAAHTHSHTHTQNTANPHKQAATHAPTKAFAHTHRHKTTHACTHACTQADTHMHTKHSARTQADTHTSTFAHSYQHKGLDTQNNMHAPKYTHACSCVKRLETTKAMRRPQTTSINIHPFIPSY